MNVLVLDDWAMDEMKRKLIVLAFAVGICAISFVGFAQAKENEEKSLQGKWYLEKVSISEVNSIGEIDTDSLGFDVYDELEFLEGSLMRMTTSNGKSIQLKYNCDGFRFEFDKQSLPLNLEVSFMDEKIYLLIRIEKKTEVKTYFVSLIYHK